MVRGAAQIGAAAGHLAVWAGLYVAGAVVFACQASGLWFRPGSSRGLALLGCATATAMSVYLLDRVKLADRWLDPADREAKPGRFEFLSRHRGPARGLVAGLGLAGMAMAMAVHWAAALLVAPAWVGVLLYGGWPGPGAGDRRRRLKDLFLIKNASVAAAITAFACALVTLSASGGAGVVPGDFFDTRIEPIATAAVLLFWRVFADAALCDIDDERSDRRFGTRTIPVRYGRTATWVIAMAISIVLLAASAILPGPPGTVRLRVMWAALNLASGVILGVWRPRRLRDYVDARFGVIAAICLAAQ